MIIYYLAPSLQAKVPPRQSKWNQKSKFNLTCLFDCLFKGRIAPLPHEPNSYLQISRFNMIRPDFGIMKEKDSIFLDHQTDFIVGHLCSI
jgi:hypothetical protein